MNNGDGIDVANIDWGAGEAGPRSIFFSDIYFSGDGPEEARHVFLDGNALPTRFKGAGRIHIGELGFGTGLNLLVAWDAWRAAAKREGAALHFFSVEAFPLAGDDMARAHAHWPHLSDLAAMLQDRLPPVAPGFHHIALDDDVALTLYYGDAFEGLSRTTARMDAWFLDGFAPAKNPDMWRPDLMREISRLSAPGATLATFSVAGAVRRALTEAGFAIEKRPGYGRKREMLTATLEETTAAKVDVAPWFASPSAETKPNASVAIIGGGIAGASLAFTLRRAGLSPTIYEQTAPAAGASGNPAGIVMPRLDADDTPAGRFHASAYLHTIRLLRLLNADAANGFFTPCGVNQLTTDPSQKRRFEKVIAANRLPNDWIVGLENGVGYPQGGAVDPAAFVRALIGATSVVREQVDELRWHDGAGWTLATATGGAFRHDAVVIANAADAVRFSQMRSIPLQRSAGQVEFFPDAPSPHGVITGGPYLAPALGGGLVIGATYKNVESGERPATNLSATESTIDAIRKLAPQIAQSLEPAASIPRASIRCTTPDRMPVVGRVPDWGFFSGAYDGLRHGKRMTYPAAQYFPDLYVVTGLGSRGLVTAPLAAAMIASDMTGAPAPCDHDVAAATHPARFFIRNLKRGASRKS